MRIKPSKYTKQTGHAFSGAGVESDIPKDMESAIKKMMQGIFDHVVSQLEINSFTPYDWGPSGTPEESHVIISLGTPWGDIGGISLEKLLLDESADRAEIADLLEDLADKIRNPIKWKKKFQPS